jgi:iron complex transport system permease protein
MKKNIFLIIIFIFLLLTILITPFIGSQSLDYSKVIAYLRGEHHPDATIFFQIRLPRILVSVITGASLALAGVIFQALLRNPLATPYTLGVSSGGALGAVIMIKLGLGFSILNFSAIQTSAFLGSMLTILFVYYLARKSGKISVYTMILAGVTISYFFGAVILMLHFLADFTETHQMIRWMMGGLDVVNYRIVLQTIPILFIAYVVLFTQSKMLNIIGTSEESALSKGVSVNLVQKISFISASLITGIVVAISGPIGFVGLIIPHLLRLFIGVDHRYLIPASIFLGGGFLALCDTIARTIISPIDIPVGIITAILGGPFFLWLLIKKI